MGAVFFINFFSIKLFFVLIYIIIYSCELKNILQVYNIFIFLKYWEIENLVIFSFFLRIL